MRLSRYTLSALFLLVFVAAVYRVIPGRPWGFAPQFAMTLFCGAVIKDKKIAFILPLFSMFISDILYQILYINGFTALEGFYDGIVGFSVDENNVRSILKGSLFSPTVYFVLSNFITWLSGGGLQRPKTLVGMMQAFADGVPFYGNSLVATLLFSFILFGAHQFIFKPVAINSAN